MNKQERNMQVLIAALLFEKKNKEFILTKDLRKKMSSMISFSVCSELDDELNERFYLVSKITGKKLNNV